MSTLKEEFYQLSPQIAARNLLGKYLVHNSSKGPLSAMIEEVEINPTLKSHIHNRKAGTALISLNIKNKYQLAVAVGEKSSICPIVIRKATPFYGMEIMQENFEGEVFNTRDMTRFPGSLCKSFGITAELDGVSLVSSNLSIEDREVLIDLDQITVAQDKKQRWRYSIGSAYF